MSLQTTIFARDHGAVSSYADKLRRAFPNAAAGDRLGLAIDTALISTGGATLAHVRGLTSRQVDLELAKWGNMAPSDFAREAAAALKSAPTFAAVKAAGVSLPSLGSLPLGAVSSIATVAAGLLRFISGMTDNATLDAMRVHAEGLVTYEFGPAFERSAIAAGVPADEARRARVELNPLWRSLGDAWLGTVNAIYKVARNTRAWQANAVLAPTKNRRWLKRQGNPVRAKALWMARTIGGNMGLHTLRSGTDSTPSKKNRLKHGSNQWALAEARSYLTSGGATAAALERGRRPTVISVLRVHPPKGGEKKVFEWFGVGPGYKVEGAPIPPRSANVRQAQEQGYRNRGRFLLVGNGPRAATVYRQDPSGWLRIGAVVAPVKRNGVYYAPGSEPSSPEDQESSKFKLPTWALVAAALLALNR